MIALQLLTTFTAPAGRRVAPLGTSPKPASAKWPAGASLAVAFVGSLARTEGRRKRRAGRLPSLR